MILSPREAPAYFAKPDPNRAALLIYGADAMRVSLKRQQAVAALIGPDGEAEMRLTRLSGAEIRRDPALLIDSLKAVSFFPGVRVVLIDEAGDSITGALEAALADWRPGDAAMVLTAGQLNKSSSLRKLLEKHLAAYAIGIYDDPPSREEIAAELKRAGIANLPNDTLTAISELSREIDPGDFRQVLEKLALYKLGDPSPTTPEDLAAVAPATIEAELDEAIQIVADARTQEIGPLMRRLEAQGVTAVTLCLMATRHFRSLLTVASDPGGPGAGIGKLRPPAFGKRREQIERQARHWGRTRLEQALGLLIDTDLTLRSTSRAPALPLVERALIRIAQLGRR